MATRFVDAPLPGNDTNDGLDNIGVGLATATWTAATTTLTQSGHGYTFSTGDLIFISGGTGATTGLYEVESAGANDIVLADPHTNTAVVALKDGSDLAGGDLASGDIASSDGPLLTIDVSMNAVSAGDEVWVRGGTDYQETVTIDTAGGLSSFTVFRGYTTTTGDGGKATIDAQSTRTNCLVSSLGNTYYRFENFIFENATGDGVAGSTMDVVLFVNCEANSNGTRGFDLDNSPVFVNCSATSNSGDGIGFDQGGLCCYCTAHANTLDGFDDDLGGACFYSCVASYNSGAGITSRSSAFNGAATVISCTIDGNADDSTVGIWNGAANSYIVTILNSIVYDCATGIRAGASMEAQQQIGFNNLLNANATNYQDWYPTSTDVTGAPSFTDEGSQDYTLAAGSAARNAGADNSGSSSPGMDIGALQSADVAVVTTVIAHRPRRTM